MQKKVFVNHIAISYCHRKYPHNQFTIYCPLLIWGQELGHRVLEKAYVCDRCYIFHLIFPNIWSECWSLWNLGIWVFWGQKQNICICDSVLYYIFIFHVVIAALAYCWNYIFMHIFSIHNEWVFDKLKGIPSTMRWPVQVLKTSSDGTGTVDVFCKSDYAV